MPHLSEGGEKVTTPVHSLVRASRYKWKKEQFRRGLEAVSEKAQELGFESKVVRSGTSSRELYRLLSGDLKLVEVPFCLC